MDEQSFNTRLKAKIRAFVELLPQSEALMSSKGGRETRLKFCFICVFSTQYPKNSQKSNSKDGKLKVREGKIYSCVI